MPSRRRAIATLLAAGVGAGCLVPDDRPRRRRISLDEIAERYVRLTLRLAQHQPSLVETWLGPEGWRPGPRGPVAAVRQEIDATLAALADFTPRPDQSDRYRYLQQQLGALVVAARRLAGEALRFSDEARAAFAIPGLNLREGVAATEDARGELERRLPGRGPLHDRYAAFRARHAIKPDRIVPAFHAAIEACRDRMGGRVTLPDGERVDVDSAADFGLEAQAIYLGDYRTRVTIDASGPLDLARLVWLAAHETYPGHHMQHVLADRDCVRLEDWRERALHPTFGRHLLCAEGAAEAGAGLLLDGEGFAEICRPLVAVAMVSEQAVDDLVAVDRAVATLDSAVPAIAEAYLDDEIGSEAAIERLTREALIGNARRFLTVIERLRIRLLGYPIGRRRIAAILAAAPPEQRWPRLAAIASTLIE